MSMLKVAGAVLVQPLPVTKQELAASCTCMPVSAPAVLA